MRQVPERPLFPQVVPTTQTGLVDFAATLVRQLVATFQEYGYRLNRTLPADGSESAAMLGLAERSADPADPAAGHSVIWQSDGTGAGDDGDLMIKLTDSGGTTKTATLIDFSAV